MSSLLFPLGVVLKSFTVACDHQKYCVQILPKQFRGIFLYSLLSVFHKSITELILVDLHVCQRTCMITLLAFVVDSEELSYLGD